MKNKIFILTQTITKLLILILFVFIFLYNKTGHTKNGEGRILFTSQGYLWAVNPDGSDEENLCDISMYEELVMSPSKEKIAGLKEQDVFVMNCDGSSALNITKSPEIEGINAFSPYGEKIICLLKAEPEELMGFLGIAKTNGTGYTRIDEYFIKKNQNIGWSPDREKITFTYKNILYVIPITGEWIKGLGSEKLKNLTPYNPSWSPDGERIAFRANKSGVGDLWIINVENEHFRPLYSSGCHQNSHVSEAEWSPSGEALVFEAPHPTLSENNIYRIFSDGTSLKLLGRGSNPHWSPDSRKVFYKVEGGKMKVADSGLNSYSSNRKIYPAFYSPDLRKIVYTNKATKEAWILDLETKENHFVTGGDVNVLGWVKN